MKKNSIGTFYGIGIGPGDPELLTLKAHRLIKTLPRLYVPFSSSTGSSYARKIIQGYLDKSEQKLTELKFAMRGTTEEMARQWMVNGQIIANCLENGLDAGFITEGDPLLYSTFVHLGSIMKTICPQAPVIVVPGISSFQAAAAATNLSLADRDERLAIMPANYDPDGLLNALETFDTIILLKISSVIDKVLTLLEKLDLVKSAVFISRCGHADELIVRDVLTLRGQKLDYFSLLIVRRIS